MVQLNLFKSIEAAFNRTRSWLLTAAPLSFQQRWEVGDNDLPVLIQYHLEIFHKTLSTTTKRVRGMKKAFPGDISQIG